MGAVKNYLLDLQSIGEDLEQQDAIEWAIISRWVPITCHRDIDRATITQQLPAILEAYRRRVLELQVPAA